MAAATPNPSEAEALTGIAVQDPATAAEAGRRMRTLGIGIACAKLGDGGCVVTHRESSTHVPPVPVEAVDSTGAGDAFAGALAVALMEGRPAVGRHASPSPPPASQLRSMAPSLLIPRATGSRRCYPRWCRGRAACRRPDVPPPAPSDLVFDHYDPTDETRRESLLTLGNRVLLVRAAAPWASAGGAHYPGTYRAGCYDPLDQEINGERLDCEVLVNLPNWLPLTFRIEGEAAWFSLEDVEILEYRHGLDMAAGIAARDIDFRDQHGRHTRLAERRLVSMAQPDLAALTLEVRPEDWTGRIEIRSALDGGVVNAKVARFRPLDGRHFDVLGAEAGADGLLLRARTRRSGTGIAVATRTRLTGGTVVARWSAWDGAVAAEHALCEIGPETGLVMEKLAAIVTGPDPAAMDTAAVARGAVLAAPGFQRLREAHAEAWRRLHDGAGFAVERPDLDRALRPRRLPSAADRLATCRAARRWRTRPRLAGGLSRPGLLGRGLCPALPWPALPGTGPRPVALPLSPPGCGSRDGTRARPARRHVPLA